MSNKNQVNWDDDIVLQLREAAKFVFIDGLVKMLINAADEIDKLRNIIKEKDNNNTQVLEENTEELK